LGSESEPQIDSRDIDAEVVGYIYHPGGRNSNIEPELLLRESVAHFALRPDPIANYRGMSWLTPIIREIQGDSAATAHKELFFTNGATPNMVVSLGISDPAKFTEWVEKFEENHTGLANAYRTLYLGAGSTAEVVGANMQQIDFKVTQGAGETRIAAASGMHPVILGLSEGLQGSSLNQGNFMAARRLVADMTLRPWWGNFASSMEVLISPPGGSRLWYDDRHIPFLAEDVKDAAAVLKENMLAIEAGIRSGFIPDTVVESVTSGDLTRLEHTGLTSVQLLPPGTTTPDAPAKPAIPAEA
ncbi:MAG: phage portal protein, partial [Candidatus Limnocylindria bacterium]